MWFILETVHNQCKIKNIKELIILLKYIHNTVKKCIKKKCFKVKLKIFKQTLQIYVQELK